MVIIIVIAYFLSVTAIGVYSHFKIKNPDDYYIAGKKGGFWQISGSLLATILGSSAILGSVELAQAKGWPAVWFLLSAAIGLFILAPITKHVSRYGKYTLPELLGTFFGKKAKNAAEVIIPVAWLGVIAVQIIGAAIILSSINFLSYKMAALLSGGVFIAYTLIGGQKSVIKTDMFQALLILSGILALFFSVQFGKNGAPAAELPKPVLFNELFSFADLLILFLTYSATFVVGPDIYSRIFCARSEKTAARSVLFVAVLLVPFALVMTWLGVFSGIAGPGSKIHGLIALGTTYLPDWAFGLLIAALLSAVMSSASTTLLTTSMIFSGLVSGSLEKGKAYRNTRLFIVLFGIGSIAIAVFISSVIQVLLLALAFFSGAFIVPVLAGLLRLKVNKQNAVAAIVCGGLTALAGKIIGATLDELAGNLIIIGAYMVNIVVLFHKRNGIGAFKGKNQNTP